MHNELKHRRNDELAAIAARALLDVLDGAHADDVEGFTGFDAATSARIVAIREELSRRLEARVIVLPNLDGSAA
jgi:hypothetical protein